MFTLRYLGIETFDWHHLVQVSLSVTPQRNGVQVRLRVFDGVTDDASLGCKITGVRGHQLHLDLTHFVMRCLLGCTV